MGLDIHLDRNGGSPIFRQLAEQVRLAVQDGRLQPGERLPTVRHLAAQLGVTPLTVHRAFRDLQAGGCLEATVGRGTFVRRAAPAAAAPAAPARRVTAERIMAEIQRFGHDRGMTNLAHAEPDPSLIPAGAFWDCLLALRADAASHLQYVSPQGDPSLRQALQGLLRRRGLKAPVEEILVTSGVTQGLSLAAGALARPGDHVAVEEPTYLGLLHILEAQGLRAVGVPLDREGPRLDALERVILHHRPRFFYTIPTFHNPTGRSMSPARRRALMALAGRHGLFVVEDDIYHHLAYRRPLPPTLKSLDRKGLVVYLDGLSKAALPGVRAGYAFAAPPIVDRMLSLRLAADLCGPLIIQRALALFLRRESLGAHMKRILPHYRRRRDAMLKALARWMPDSVSWTEPEGGFSCWLTLPARDELRDLYSAALEKGVVLAPGEVFFTGPAPGVHIRLCFGTQPEPVIVEGVRILAGLVKDRLRGAPGRARPAVDRAPLV